MRHIVLDIDSLISTEISTNKPSFLKLTFLHAEKLLSKSALTRNLLSVVNRLEAVAFCATSNDVHIEALSVHQINKEFPLILATSKSLEELKRDNVFQNILANVQPDGILVSNADAYIKERLIGYLHGLGNTKTMVLVAQGSKPHRSFLDPIQEWAAQHAIPSRKVVIMTEDRRLLNVARVYFNFKTRTGEFFSLFYATT